MSVLIPSNEQAIVDIFLKNVYGKKPDQLDVNKSHDGRYGHWLERQMGIEPNSSNTPDLLGYEMKNNTTSKTTFGDWSADYYIFKDTNISPRFSRENFLRVFGNPNPNKNNRYSWSGSVVPNIHRPSIINGSIMTIARNQDIYIKYNYSDDPRHNKATIVPEIFKKNEVILAHWLSSKLTEKLHNKFGQNGWFKCYQAPNGTYNRIAFGAPMNFDSWIHLVRKGIVFFDSGMFEGNSRPYSQWRAGNNYWESLIIRSYP